MTRADVHRILLPGVAAEECRRVGGELRRDAVYLHERWIGDVIYVERPNGSCGWRPSRADARSKLTCRVLAVGKLPALSLRVGGTTR